MAAPCPLGGHFIFSSAAAQQRGGITDS